MEMRIWRLLSALMQMMKMRRRVEVKTEMVGQRPEQLCPIHNYVSERTPKKEIWLWGLLITPT